MSMSAMCVRPLRASRDALTVTDGAAWRPRKPRAGPQAMLIYSMSVSVDGFIVDRGGGFEWSVPGEEQFRFHVAQTRELGGLCGRRLYETMLPWETDPSMRTPSSRPRSPTSGAQSRRWSSAARSTGSRAMPGSPRRRWLRRPLRRSRRPTRTSRSAVPASPRQRSSSASSTSFKGVPQPGRRRRRHAFLPPVTEDIRLALVETRTFGSRVIDERYRRARD